MKKLYALFFIVGVVALTSGCSKYMEKVKTFVKKHKVVTAAVATGAAATGLYYRDSIGLNFKKDPVIDPIVPFEKEPEPKKRFLFC